MKINKKIKPIYIYNECDDIDGDCTYWEYCEDEMDEILESKSYLLISGSAGSWQGRREIDIVIQSMSFGDLAEKYLHMENVRIAIYKDGVEYKNFGHDANSYYDFIPIELMDLTKKELLESLDEDEYKDYTGRKSKYAVKEDLVNYIEEMGFIET